VLVSNAMSDAILPARSAPVERLNSQELLAASARYSLEV
jgi:hypothetical protein